jgi:hypothetical protein
VESVRTNYNPNKPGPFERIRDLEKHVIDLEYQLFIATGQRDDESGVLGLVAERRDELVKVLSALIDIVEWPTTGVRSLNRDYWMERAKELIND